jgi:hypothetical protein
MAEKKGVNRRDFLKIAGLTGVVLPAVNVVGNLAGYEYLASRDAYGGFVVRRATEANPPYQVDDSMYKRMNCRNMGIARAMWDMKGRMELIKTVMSMISKEEAAQLMAAMNPQKMGAMAKKGRPPEGFGPMGMIALMNMKRKIPGKTIFDYAFSGGAWTVASTLGTMNESGMAEMLGMVGDCPGLYSWEPLGGMGGFMYNLQKADKFDPAEYDYSPQELTDMVKTVAKFYGASMVGIAEVDERWFYSHDFNMGSKKDAPILFEDVEAPTIRDDHTKVVPKSMKYVVALAFEMDYDGIKQNFNGCSDAAVGMGYSRMAFTAGSLAEFFRHLGYHAIPMGNDTSLSPPSRLMPVWENLDATDFCLRPSTDHEFDCPKSSLTFPWYRIARSRSALLSSVKCAANAPTNAPALRFLRGSVHGKAQV